jgi:amidase
MTRAAEDLEAALRVLAGPELPDSKAFQWTLPKARRQSLRDYRIGYVLDDPAAPVSTETKSVLEAAIRACEKAGAKVTQGWPDGCRFQEMLDTYLFLLGAFDFSMSPAESQRQARVRLEKRSDSMAKGALSSFAEWQGQNLKRLVYRVMWEKLFESIDVFLLPTVFTTAFPHDHTPIDTRMIPMPEGGVRKVWDILAYIAPATLTGCPATTAPAGLSKSGLPVGLQIMGPYLEDATPIGFAELLAREIGGFEPPKGYGNPIEL